MAFEEPRDVGEIFLSLASAPRRILNGPYLSPQDIVDGGDRKCEAQHVAWDRAIDKGSVPRIELHLNSEIRGGYRYVEAVRKPLDIERRRKHRLHFRELIGGDHDVQIKTDNRLDVRIHRLTTNQAEPYVTGSEELEEPLEQI